MSQENLCATCELFSKYSCCEHDRGHTLADDACRNPEVYVEIAEDDVAQRLQGYVTLAEKGLCAMKRAYTEALRGTRVGAMPKLKDKMDPKVYQHAKKWLGDLSALIPLWNPPPSFQLSAYGTLYCFWYRGPRSLIVELNTETALLQRDWGLSSSPAHGQDVRDLSNPVIVSVLTYAFNWLRDDTLTL